jgi:hypothetical protein
MVAIMNRKENGLGRIREMKRCRSSCLLLLVLVDLNVWAEN